MPAPNIFALGGILIIHTYSLVTGTHFEAGSDVLFAVLCLPFSYSVTIGIPLYLQLAKSINAWFPVS